MPSFEYQAIDPSGRKVKGAVDAENVRAARSRLRSQGIFPTDIKEGSAARKSNTRDIRQYLQSDKVGTRDLSICTRQLATLSAAGLPLVSALAALSDQTEEANLRRIVIDVREKVEGGASLAKALGNFPKAFPRLYVNMVASGEASGTLDTVLTNLADYLEAQVELRGKIQGALIYPVIMFVICTLVVSALLVFVVPTIVDIFRKQGAILPLPTRIVIGVSDFITNYWFVLIALIVGAGYLISWYYRQPAGRDRIDRWLIRAPLYGPILVKVVTARITRTLGALLSSGVGLLTGLEITKNIVNNVHYVRALETAQEGVREGRALAKEMSKSGLFPPMVGHMIAVGEKSGDLEGMLGKVGKTYENEVNTTLSGLTRIIEPLMMVGVGGIVLLIVVAVLLPMVDLIDIVQRR